MTKQKAIIHTLTRVIRRITIDDAPKVGVDESIIELEQPIDLAQLSKGQFWKFNEKNEKVLATQEEIDAAGVDEMREAEMRRVASREYIQAMDNLINDVTLTPGLKIFFTKLRGLYK